MTGLANLAGDIIYLQAIYFTGMVTTRILTRMSTSFIRVLLYEVYFDYIV